MQRLILMALLAGPPALAEQPKDFLDLYTAEARSSDPGFTGFDADRGGRFFRSRHQSDWSCSTCHTENPVNVGQHAVTGKSIRPLAPPADPERFTRREKVDKWFRRNCNDVLKRACTPLEKGDVLTYLMAQGS